MQFGEICPSTQEYASQKVLAYAYVVHDLSSQPGAPQDHFQAGLSSKCVQAFLRFRLGRCSLPCFTAHVANIFRALRVCALCQTCKLGKSSICA